MYQTHLSPDKQFFSKCHYFCFSVSINYEHWKRENELFKQAELEKKNRMEALKGNKESKDKGGKMTAGGKKDDKKKEEKKKSTPTPSAKNPRQTAIVTSRSASRNKDLERSRTPKTANLSIFTDNECDATKLLYRDKAYINVYQELCKLVDGMETIFSEIIQNVDIEERLSEVVFKASVPMVALNSDYID